MPYQFLLDREPSDEELKILTDAAMQAVKEKKEAAINRFMSHLSQEFTELKRKKLEHAH